MNDHRTFIETQFPVSKLSKESYKERMSHETQTLTNLGKWWGWKPLILVRATLLGLLMPALFMLIPETIFRCGATIDLFAMKEPA